MRREHGFTDAAGLEQAEAQKHRVAHAAPDCTGDVRSGSNVLYEQYLCRDFPRVPIINTPEKERDEGEFYVSEELYREYVSVGERLRKLHLMQIKAPAELALEPNTPDDMEIGAIKYKNGVLQLNANKRITGISQEAWKYQIGGHQVLDKWFKEHKGETLTIDSYTHIENVVGLLEETIKLREYLRSLH